MLIVVSLILFLALLFMFSALRISSICSREEENKMIAEIINFSKGE